MVDACAGMLPIGRADVEHLWLPFPNRLFACTSLYATSEILDFAQSTASALRLLLGVCEALLPGSGAAQQCQSASACRSEIQPEGVT
eukprot:CAMPEP_0172682178 /NCGR_PEP_ID=MMETSP1074-20121228/17980_1 /TAXON_ID=2916 /ORGANISM="Ceratium fusus, Strain PA161109" /LENGTH=86 /DNA_ID=CAMNT_0013500815 /DNA_START=1 /DNA_END=258 /DNA_ORIENTATION=-